MDAQTMKQKLESTKKFVRTHKVKIAAAAGIIAGIAITLAVQQKGKRDPYDNMTLTIDEEHLNKLASEGGSVQFDDVDVRGTVYVRRPQPEDNFPTQTREQPDMSFGINEDYLNSLTNEDGSIVFDDIDALSNSLGIDVIESQK